MMVSQELSSPYHSPWAKITKDVLNALAYQDGKWGTSRDHDTAFWMLIATEEFGEVARALLEHSTRQEIKLEIAQFMAVLTQLYIKVDKID